MESVQGHEAEGATASALRVRLLGGFGLSLDGRPLGGFEAPRLQSLLAYLLINRGNGVPRDRLAFTFWPDSEEGQARTNLRQALYNVRRALPNSELFVETGSRAIGWRADAPAWLDIEAFEVRLCDGADARAAGDTAAERQALDAATELYTGDLAPDCYDDWIVPERERLRVAHLAAAERLAELLEQDRDYRQAVRWARRVYEHDPLNETANQRLIRLHALAGDRAAALRVYHGFATALARETGVEPSPSTREAYERLLEPEPGTARSPAPSQPAAAYPFVGRAAEWATLHDAWGQAESGHAGLALITGEAGIGKSRLCDEIREWALQQGIATAASRCYPLAGGLAYAPVVELLRSPAITSRVRRLDATWLSELARLLPELLAERPDLRPPTPLTDEWQRMRLFDALNHALLAEPSPLLITIDDLQWCDSETLGWIQYVLGSQPNAPILVLATGRPELLDPDHPARPLRVAAASSGQAVDLALEPLDAAETVKLAEGVSGGDLTAGNGELVFRETEGNPLFVVEWVRAGLAEQPARRAGSPEASAKMPPRMLSVIEGRLSQLSTAAQELATLAATVGRDFTFDLLATAGGQAEEELVDALDELWSRRILAERGSDAYDFSHDKIREAAYARSGSAQRLLLHRRVAQAIERLHAADLDSVAGELARHYEAAGWPERAAGFYLRGAEVARGVYANDAAIDLYNQALRLLDSQPASKHRDERELEVLTALGSPLVAREGYAATEVQSLYLRARDACERLGVRPGAPVLRGLALYHVARGEIEESHRLGGQLLALGAEDPIARVEGHYVTGVTSFWLGNLNESRRHLEAAIKEYDPANSALHIAEFSQDPRAVCLSRLGYAVNFLGEPEHAEAITREAIDHAEALGHPFSLAYALTFASWLAIDQSKEELACERAARFAELTQEHRLGYLEPMGLILRGWIASREGDSEGAIELINAGLEDYRRSGWLLYEPYALILLARVCLGAGRGDQARLALAEARELAERTGQRVFDDVRTRLEAQAG